MEQPQSSSFMFINIDSGPSDFYLTVEHICQFQLIYFIHKDFIFELKHTCMHMERF